MHVFDPTHLLAELLGRAPDLAAVELVMTRLRQAGGSADDAVHTLHSATRGPGSEAGPPSWSGAAARAAQAELHGIGTALARWSEDARQLGSRLQRTADDAAAELRRRAHLHASVTGALGRLATLPADVHREFDAVARTAEARLLPR